MISLSTKIDNLYYSTIERKITDFYDMGMPTSSNIHVECSKDTHGTYTLIGSKKEGNLVLELLNNLMVIIGYLFHQ